MMDKSREMVADLTTTLMPLNKGPDPYWDLSSRMYFMSLIEILFKKASSSGLVNFRILCAMNSTLMADEDLRNRVLKSPSPKDIETFGMETVLVNADNTRKCLSGTFLQKLSLFNTQNVLADMLSENDLDLSTIGSSKPPCS